MKLLEIADNQYKVFGFSKPGQKDPTFLGVWSVSSEPGRSIEDGIKYYNNWLERLQGRINSSSPLYATRMEDPSGNVVWKKESFNREEELKQNLIPNFIDMLKQFHEELQIEVIAMMMGKWKAERDAKHWVDNSEFVVPILKEATLDVLHVIQDAEQLSSDLQKQKKSRIMMRALVAKWHKNWKQLKRLRERSKARYQQNFRKYSSEIDAYQWLEQRISANSIPNFRGELRRIM